MHDVLLYDRAGGFLLHLLLTSRSFTTKAVLTGFFKTMRQFSQRNILEKELFRHHDVHHDVLNAARAGLVGMNDLFIFELDDPVFSNVTAVMHTIFSQKLWQVSCNSPQACFSDGAVRHMYVKFLTRDAPRWYKQKHHLLLCVPPF